MIHLIFISSERAYNVLSTAAKRFCDKFYGKTVCHHCPLTPTHSALVTFLNEIARQIVAGDEVWLYVALPITRYLLRNAAGQSVGAWQHVFVTGDGSLREPEAGRSPADNAFRFEWLYHWLIVLRTEQLAAKVVCILDTVVTDATETESNTLTQTLTSETPWSKADLWFDPAVYQLNGLALPFDGLVILSWTQLNTPKPDLCGLSIFVAALQLIFSRLEPQSWLTIRADAQYLCDLYSKAKYSKMPDAANVQTEYLVMLFATGMQEYLQLGSDQPYFWAANQYRVCWSESNGPGFALDVGLGLGHDFTYTYLVADGPRSGPEAARSAVDGQTGVSFPLRDQKVRHAKMIMPMTPFQSLFRILPPLSSVPDYSFQTMCNIAKHQGGSHAWKSLLEENNREKAPLHQTSVLLRPPFGFGIALRIDNEHDLGLVQALTTLEAHRGEPDCFLATQKVWYTVEIRRNPIHWRPTWPEAWSARGKELLVLSERTGWPSANPSPAELGVDSESRTRVQQLYDEVYAEMYHATHVDRWSYLFLAACLRTQLRVGLTSSRGLLETALSYCRLCVQDEDFVLSETAIELFYTLHREQEFYLLAPPYLPGTIRQDPRYAFDRDYKQVSIPCRLELLYAMLHLHYWSVLKLYQLTVARNYYWEYAKSHLNVRIGAHASLRANGRGTMTSLESPCIQIHSYDGETRPYQMYTIRFNPMATIETGEPTSLHSNARNRHVATMSVDQRARNGSWTTIVLILVPDRTRLPNLTHVAQGSVCYSRSTLESKQRDILTDHYYPEYEIFHVQME